MCTCVCFHTCIHMCMCAYVCIFHECVRVRIHICAHVCMCFHACVNMCMCVPMCILFSCMCICVPLTGGNCHSRESGGSCVSEVKHAEKGKPCTFSLRYGSRGSQAHRDDSGVRLWQLGSGRGDNSQRVCCFQQEE